MSRPVTTSVLRPIRALPERLRTRCGPAVPRFGRMAALLAVAAFGAGCGPYLNALTAPPPTLHAELDSMRDTVELSVGVALAFSCTGWEGIPCRNAKIASDAPAIAEAFPSHLSHLTPELPYFPGPRMGSRPETGFVVFGRSAGTTLLRLTSADGDLAIAVTVKP